MVVGCGSLSLSSQTNVHEYVHNIYCYPSIQFIVKLKYTIEYLSKQGHCSWLHEKR